ncbi:hypothetical protein DMC14_003210 [Metamycoplasma phocicerebrale]|uniref:YwaF family protein n=1 Tax=Metamycoplasma phocicerebrale TaxID=142649 RepID=A0A3Q9V8X3_9BACT|nr:YwaF family protein [Metamycoplasma phocicerebrale]AZZ65772.1 hypothetical protein DMC14_003210 [Metamycoplasma phocicerebrale]
MSVFWNINNDNNKLYSFFSSFNFEEPNFYGWFHLTYLIIFLKISIFLVSIIKKPNSLQTKLVFLVLYIPLFFIELLKQIYATGSNFGEYKNNTWAFPMVLCSMPLYLIPIYLAIPSKHKIISNTFLSYLSIMNLWSGCFVMFYPGDVFTKNVFISNHTMIYHGILLVLGIWTVLSQAIKYNWKNILSGYILFIIIFILIIIGNEIIYQLDINNKTDFEPNLFNMSHRYGSPLISNIPVFKKLKPWIPTLVYPFFTILGSFIIYTIFWGFSIAILKIQKQIIDKKLVKENKNSIKKLAKS